MLINNRHLWRRGLMLALALMICLSPCCVGLAQAPGCSITLQQDTAMVGQPVYAQVNVPEGVPRTAYPACGCIKQGLNGQKSLPCWRRDRSVHAR